MEKTKLSPLDPSSFSRPELAVVTNIALNLHVSFHKKTLSGAAELTVEKTVKTTKEVILDTNHLNISFIYDFNSKEHLPFAVGEFIAGYGCKLAIQLPQEDKPSYKIVINYETSPEASGLLWVSPEGTAGQKHPFLFSLFQPIHARSVLPCQDSPGVKTPYTAKISAPKELTALMSAIRKGTNEQDGENKFFHFVQKVPVPAYLIAIAVGALESKQIGPRTHIWCEKEIIEESAYEFANTERQLKIAEDLCGPYVWGIYDLLVLPPSFAYGGMEHPCLTFVTPTLLAGDRSLESTIAHEIAHSWSGNLVTNKNYEHFWLNEGFTDFIERKIKGKLESPAAQDFEAYMQVGVLAETINVMGKTNPLTQLVVDLDKAHPDDAFSIIPYEKGQTFLRYLETLVGGPAQMERFLVAYFDKFKYQSIDTDGFKNFFEGFFSKNENIKAIDWQTWLYSPGMPPFIPDYDKTLALICDELIDRFLSWNDEDKFPIALKDKQELSALQVIYVLQKILEQPPQSLTKLRALDKVFEFDKVKNAEIKVRWLRIALKAHWEEKIDSAISWINGIGRMKYVSPLYRDLYAWERTRQRAIDNFRLNKKYMMHITKFNVAKDLHLDDYN